MAFAWPQTIQFACFLVIMLLQFSVRLNVCFPPGHQRTRSWLCFPRHPTTPRRQSSGQHLLQGRSCVAECVCWNRSCQGRLGSSDAKSCMDVVVRSAVIIEYNVDALVLMCLLMRYNVRFWSTVLCDFWPSVLCE